MSDADAVVIVTGLQADDEGQAAVGAGDRHGLALADAGAGLIRAAAALNGRVVVVLEGGGAILTSGWRDDVVAVVMAFYPGAMGGAALADVLFGDAAPSRRLPFSIAEREADLPVFDHGAETVTDGYLHGYRHLAGTRVAAAVTVTNRGAVRAIETPQGYVAAQGSRGRRVICGRSDRWSSRRASARG